MASTSVCGTEGFGSKPDISANLMPTINPWWGERSVKPWPSGSSVRFQT